MKEQRTLSITLLLLVVISFGYALQVLSPLRLNTDAIVLLSMADSAAQGKGFLANGRKTVFPPGYPALLSILLKAGLAHPWVIVVLNLVFLAIGLGATFHILKVQFGFNPRDSLILTVLPLFSYIMIKHSSLPLTDVPFFGCSAACLALLSRVPTAKGRRLVLLMAAASVLVLASLAIRRIGIALIPAWFSALAFRPDIVTDVRRWLIHRRSAIIVAVPILLAMLVWGASHILTMSDFVLALRKFSPTEIAGKLLSMRLTEAGELLLNVPQSKFPGKSALLAPVTGFFTLALSVGGLLARRKRLGSVDIFVISYLAILFVWPFIDSRFWLPIIPFVFAYISLFVGTLGIGRLSSALTFGYCSLFVITGFVSFIYTTQVTFSGPRFPDVYGDGTLRSSYCVFFESCTPIPGGRKANPRVVHLLREFK